MTAVNVERQLPSKFTFFAVFFNYRGKHLLRLRNINAPLPGTYDPENPNNAVRPLGNAAIFIITSRAQPSTTIASLVDCDDR